MQIAAWSDYNREELTPSKKKPPCGSHSGIVAMPPDCQ